MKSLVLHTLFAAVVSLGVARGQLSNTTYAVDTTIPDTALFLEGASGGTTATWTINPGVTVSGGRFFIGSTAVPNDGLATFVVDGGGTLNITRTGVFNLRLGQNGINATTTLPNSEAGALIVRGGSAVRLTGTTAGTFQEQPGSSITLDGIGSTFSSVGTWNAATGRFTSQTTTANGVLNSGAIPVTAVGGVISSSVFGAITTLTVLAAPPDPVLTVSAPPVIQSNGSPVNVSIPFSNTGATLPLTLTSITPGGNDVTTFTVNGFTSPVAPGGNGTINLTFTPYPGIGGPYAAELTIQSNDSANPSQTILLSATVANPAISITQERADFGTLAASPGATTANVTVTNTGGTADLTVDAFLLGTTDGFTVTSIPGPIAPGSSADIVLTFNPGAATGHFGGLLTILSDAAYNSSITLPVVANVTPASAFPGSLALQNGNFNANAYNSQNSTAPNGWTSSLVGIAGNYSQLIPNLTNLPALFWGRSGNFIQQDLSVANAGLTANQLTSLSVAFDRGYRNDTVTAGDIVLRVSLWDLVSDTEITGRDILIEDTGVIAGIGSNQLTATSIAFPVASASTGAVALRIATVEPLLNTNQFTATAIIDNVGLAFTGSYVPSIDAFGSWALAAGLDGTPGKENGPADDPDKDGVTNFDEFAFGSGPLSASSRSLVAALTADTTSDSQKELLLTVAVRSGASFNASASPSATVDGVVYQLQGSASLTAFDQTVEGPLATPVIPSSLPASPPAGYEYKTFRLAGSNGLPSRGFLRASALPVL
ncbi:MAG: choice-of-anchor D domain-containing protein [Verrucomicrobiaceae bacterium]|nr:MAG: choice-of-anchor D domain-containing protein [Verrucomicrobiaceae bacterium]